uniref:Sushi domain-containing protein n=1 Tax=Chromera velia CCMP2878 TaxID=1169474 RepID=A0A0G4HXR6_9ALVE|eukprot:Cvel_9327.t1-p1 / transcript=Cvel_9327.t1 / gene=Cvel_9327 / organism=Chromera_velia_CCMP2878 / gene_product=hypothetical protein / transcript_product=hypothetical protein / location=Cvel_scaffold535:20608-29183(-) / protein_length=1271 / sequence_SO=supercontig / SO=protein_coding / is_pseudo=false
MLPDWATRAWAHFAEEKRVGEEFRFSFLSIASIESHLQQHSSTLSDKVVKAGWTVNYVTIHETQKNTVKIYSGAKKAPMEARAIEVAKGRVFGFPSLPHLITTGGVGAYWHVDTANSDIVANSGTGVGGNANVQSVITLPCAVHLSSITYHNRPDCCVEQSVVQIVGYGSTDFVSWPQLFSCSLSWSGIQQSRTCSATDPNAGPYTHFSFHLQKVNRATDGIMASDDITISVTGISCNQATDPQPNTLSANVQRADSSQTGTTTATATFTYTCANGYQISGSATTTFTCTATAYATSQWQGGTVPTCSAVSCNQASDPQPNTLSANVQRADTSQTGTTTATATFTYTCANGYTLSGSATTTFTCTGTAYATSQWQGGTIPTCSAVSCNEASDPQPNTLSANVQRADNGQAGTTTATATFTYTCANGYQLVGSGTPTFTCTGTAYATSQWQGGTVPTCSAVSCTEASDPQPNTLSANVQRADNGQAGTTTQTATFTYTCANGYQISGSATTTFTCTATAYATSQWQGGTVPTCSAVSCTEASDPQPNTLPANVQRADSGQAGTTTQTATFTYTCATGYQIVGTATTTFTCTGTAYATSQWQGGTVPTCTAASCNEATDSQPNTPPEGTKRAELGGQTGVTGDSTVFSFSCSDGFRLPSGGAAVETDVTFECTGDATASSSWKGTPPTCIAVSCNEQTDEAPNMLTSNLVRSDSGQSGSTGTSAVFTYACNDGYSLDAPVSPSGWEFGVEGAVSFVCTGTGYGQASWLGGTVPSCSVNAALVSVGGVDLGASDFSIPSWNLPEDRGRVGFSSSFRDRVQRLSSAEDRRAFVQNAVVMLEQSGMKSGTLISTEDLPFPEEVSATVSDVAVFPNRFFVDTAVEGLETDMETADEEGKRKGVYFAVQSVSDWCTLRHKGEEATCVVSGEGSFECSVKNGENGRQGSGGDVLKMESAERSKGFKFISVLGSVTMFVEEVPVVDVSSLPLWLIIVIAVVSILCIIGPIVGGILFLRWAKRENEEDARYAGLQRSMTKEAMLKNRRESGLRAEGVEEGGGILKDQSAEKEYQLRVAVDRLDFDSEEEKDEEDEEEERGGGSEMSEGERMETSGWKREPSRSFRVAETFGESHENSEEEEDENEVDGEGEEEKEEEKGWRWRHGSLSDFRSASAVLIMDEDELGEEVGDGDREEGDSEKGFVDKEDEAQSHMHEKASENSAAPHHQTQRVKVEEASGLEILSLLSRPEDVKEGGGGFEQSNPPEMQKSWSGSSFFDEACD